MLNVIRKISKSFFIFVIILTVLLLISNSFVKAQYGDDDDGGGGDDDDPVRIASCWNTCGWSAGGRSCQSELFCLYQDGANRCVNPSCPTYSDCCCDPNTPTNPNPAGNVVNPSVTFSWNSVSGANKYAFRIDDLSNPWCDTSTTSCTSPPNCTYYSGDQCITLTNPTVTLTLERGHSYHWWVHAIKNCPNGNKWSGATGGSITVLPALSCPTNFNWTCEPAGNKVTISWNSLSGASWYKLRMNAYPTSDWYNAAAGDQIIDTSNSQNTVNITPGVSYNYDVQGVREGDVYPYPGARCPFADFTCNITDPTLGTLYIDAEGTTDSMKNSSYYGYTGLRKSDDSLGSGQKGSNIYNYLKVGQRVDSALGASNSSNIGLSGVIFGPTSLAPVSGSTTMASVMNNVKNNDGFILLYANKAYTAAASPIGVATTADRYYFYTRNSAGIYSWSPGYEQDRSYKVVLSDPIITVLGVNPKNCYSSFGGNTQAQRAQMPCFNVYIYKGTTGPYVTSFGTYGYTYSSSTNKNIYTQNITPQKIQ